MQERHIINSLILSSCFTLVACGGSSSSNNDDTIAPLLTNINLTDITHVASNSLTITGTAEDSNLASVSVTLAGEEFVASLTGQEFSVNVEAVEGANSYTITAIDSAGNTTELDGVVTVDSTSPEVSYLFPSNGHNVAASQVLIQGSITELNPSAVTIMLDGAETEATLVDSEFSATVGAKVGLNTYSLTVVDAAGNEVTKEDSFYFGERAAAGGAHSGAIQNGQTYVWGRNNKGQLGIGTVSSASDNTDDDATTSHPETPVALTTSTELTSIVFNQNASLALDVNGDVWAWGDGDDGQHGLGAADDVIDEEDQLVPVKVPGLPESVSVVRGYDHGMVLDVNGNVWSFGDNSAGQLGDGTTDDRDYPAQVSGLSNIIQISAGSKASYALDNQGRIWAWGRNTYGNLGQGHAETDITIDTIPTEVPLDAVITSIATGRDHVLALANTGEVYGWGLNASSQIGLHESETWEEAIVSPQLLPWFDDAVSVDANGNQSFVERSDGKIYPWGQNMLGSLGIEADDNVEAPSSAIFGLEGVNDLGAGALHTVAIRNDGALFSWGWSFEGSLGGGDSTISFWSYRLPILLSLPEVE